MKNQASLACEPFAHNDLAFVIRFVDLFKFWVPYFAQKIYVKIWIFLKHSVYSVFQKIFFRFFADFCKKGVFAQKKSTKNLQIDITFDSSHLESSFIAFWKGLWT
jgi:hypothetical protein